MPQQFQVLQCYQCATFQVQQVKKAKKWQCKMCGEKQSIKKVFGSGSGADCRHHVQKLNTLRGELDVQADSIVCSSVLPALKDGYHGNMPPEVVEEVHDNASSKWSKYKLLQDQNEGRDEAPEETSHLGINYTTDVKEFKSARTESRKSYKRKRADRDDYVSRSNTTPGGQQSAVSCSGDTSYMSDTYICEYSVGYQDSFPGFQNSRNNVQPPEESSYTYDSPSVSQGTKKIGQNNRFSVTSSCGFKFSETSASKYKDVSDDTIGSDKSHDIVGEKFRYRQRFTNRKTTASQGSSKWGKFMEDDEDKSSDDDENFTSDWVRIGQSSTFNPEIIEGGETNVGRYRKENSDDISPGSSLQISPGSSQQILSERILHQGRYHSNMNQDSGLDEHLTNNQTRHGGHTSWSAESSKTEHEAVSQNEHQLRRQDTPWTVAMETRRQNRTVPDLGNSSGVDSVSSSGMRVKEKQNKIVFKENFPSSIPLVRSVTVVNNSKALFLVDDFNDDDFSLDL